MNAPKLDTRTCDDLVARTEELARTYSDWRPPENGQVDAGRALIRLFAHMAEGVVERLNQAPEKNYLAFLDLIGAHVRPPQPARAPLTFHLASGSQTEAFVPARTRVAAATSEGGEVLFETEQDLVVTPAQLTAVWVRDPDSDRYTDVTAQATGIQKIAWTLFEGNQPIEHSLYLACDAIFTLPGPKKVDLTIETPGADQLAELPLDWTWWDGETWQPLYVLSSQPFSSRWHISILDMPVPAPHTINGHAAGWIRATLSDPLSPDAEVPPVERITASARISRTDLAPDLVFEDTRPIDLGKDFFPFGEIPAFNDVFYLGSEEVFSRPGAEVSIDIRMSDPPPVPINASEDLVLGWEVWNGQAWQEVGRSTPGMSDTAPFTDGTRGLTRSGRITFTLPDTLAPTGVNGQESAWLRVRILQGNYGTAGDMVQVEDEDGVPTFQNLPATWGPPSVATLSLEYTDRVESAPEACYACNDFTYADHTGALAEGRACRIFLPVEDRRPTVYLGFDRPFANRPTTLYLQVEPDPDPSDDPQGSAEPARVVWEYAGPSGWTHLGVDDGTRGIQQRGLIRFVGPPDFVSCAEFGQEGYWLRARWEGGTFPHPPRIRGVMANTTWASHTITLENEILGSSTGEPHPVFRTSRAPVLLGQRIEVLEPEPSAATHASAWVRWRQVPDFYGSGPGDRHYVLDHITGELRFGDGRQGKIPPPDRNNIRVGRYRTGGGQQGNCEAGSLTQLKTSLPYIAGAANPEAATGAADAETLEQVKARGPKTLRHRDRAVAAQDFEDLAHLASPRVARARAIAPHYDPIQCRWMADHGAEEAGRIGLILVPQSEAAQPIPDPELLRQVKTYLTDRCPPTLDLWIAGPDWIEITVTVEVAPTSLEAADVLQTVVTRALTEFLHPLTGRSDGSGWPFGRRPHQSDLFAVIEALEGVDHVQFLSLEAKEPEPLRLDRSLIFSGPHAVTALAPGEDT